MIEINDTNINNEISIFIKEYFSNSLNDGFFVGEKLSNLFLKEINSNTDIDIFITSLQKDVFEKKSLLKDSFQFSSSYDIKKFYYDNELPILYKKTQDLYDINNSLIIDSNVDLTYLNYKYNIDNKKCIENILYSLDINSSQILFDIKNSKLYMSEQYLNYTKNKELSIFSFNTPFQTIIRLLFKSHSKSVDVYIQNDLISEINDFIDLYMCSEITKKIFFSERFENLSQKYQEFLISSNHPLLIKIKNVIK